MKQTWFVIVVIPLFVVLGFVFIHTPHGVADAFIVGFAEFDIEKVSKNTDGALNEVFLSLMEYQELFDARVHNGFYESTAITTTTEGIQIGLSEAVIRVTLVRKERENTKTSMYEHIYLVSLQRNPLLWKVVGLEEIEVKLLG